jgi:glutamate-1-semialdehyde 2,1-aminomutase
LTYGSTLTGSTGSRRKLALVIYDEVLCFRLAANGAQGRFGDRLPDLTVLAKIIGGGFPVGAVGGRSDVMAAVFEHRHGKPLLPASGTFTANPVTMTAGLVTMQMLDDAAFAQPERTELQRVQLFRGRLPPPASPGR